MGRRVGPTELLKGLCEARGCTCDRIGEVCLSNTATELSEPLSRVVLGGSRTPHAAAPQARQPRPCPICWGGGGGKGPKPHQGSQG